MLSEKIKKGCLIGVLALAGLLVLIVYLISTAFEPQYENIEIKQDIGGTLLCNSVYLADLHSWQYEVDYSYNTPNKQNYVLGSGSFYGRNWRKDEQLIKYGEYFYLQTGGFGHADKVLFGKLDSVKWKEFEISPENIEQNELWISKNIYSKKGWLPQESYIKSFSNGILKVEYLYRTGEEVNDQEKRLITYKLNTETGIPEMKDIKLLNR